MLCRKTTITGITGRCRCQMLICSVVLTETDVDTSRLQKPSSQASCTLISVTTTGLGPIFKVSQEFPDVWFLIANGPTKGCHFLSFDGAFT